MKYHAKAVQQQESQGSREPVEDGLARPRAPCIPGIVLNETGALAVSLIESQSKTGAWRVEGRAACVCVCASVRGSTTLYPMLIAV